MKNNIRIRSPLKWAGGKYRIFDKINNKLPEGSRLIEPFVGSAAIFLNTDYEKYIINDKNKDLIDFYRELKKGKLDFVEDCRAYFKDKNNNPLKYYIYRDKFNNTLDRNTKSALFLYLNRHSYNGLCRYNLSSKFNVPFGKNDKPYFPEKELIFLSNRLKKATIQNKDFKSIMDSAKRGDVIYCDPPYVPINNTSNFISYTAKGFSVEQQNTLATLAAKLASRGIPVLISNHATDFTKTIYKDAKNEIFSVRRFISCNGKKRLKIDEILALYT